MTRLNKMVLLSIWFWGIALVLVTFFPVDSKSNFFYLVAVGSPVITSAMFGFFCSCMVISLALEWEGEK